MKFNKIKKILLVGLSLMLLTACDSKASSNQSVSDKEDIIIEEAAKLLAEKMYRSKACKDAMKKVIEEAELEKTNIVKLICLDFNSTCKSSKS